MNIDAHVETLNAKHAEIEKIIAREEHRPNPDSLKLGTLKKRKLRLKEEIKKFNCH